MCDYCTLKQAELIDLMFNHPQPCIVCKDTNITAAGTWMADEKTALAVGANNFDRIFAFCLCDIHGKTSEENEKLIVQAIIRSIREGNAYEI
jgi:hypothetical protein